VFVESHEGGGEEGRQQANAEIAQHQHCHAAHGVAAHDVAKAHGGEDGKHEIHGVDHGDWLNISDHNGADGPSQHKTREG